MPSLYEIRQDLETVIDGGFVVDDETGEITFDSDNLDELQAAFGEKLEACGIVLKSMRADAQSIRDEEKALRERRERMERKADRLQDYILRNVESMDGRKFETPRVALSVRKSEAVKIDDAERIPEDLKRYEVRETPDKSLIKKAIKDGQQVDGAHIETRYNLQVK